MTKDDEIFLAPPGGFKLPRVHPGEILGEELAIRGLTPHAFALKLRVPANRISEIVKGRRGISAETALRIARYFGTSAAFWLNLQTGYDLAVAEQNFGEAITREVEAA